MTAELPFNEAAADVVRKTTPKVIDHEGYYGLPMLKKPLWGWEIALYFFSEGISSGAFILAALADVCGGPGGYEKLTRNARYLALATLLPCPPLLIADLGRPERFHHMLRVIKPGSPMSLGAWALLGFSAPVGLLALRQFTGARFIPVRAVSLAGLPFAFFMVAYPGVLLSTTSIPVWSQTRLLGALLASSSMAAATGALAVTSALDANCDEKTLEVIHRIEGYTNMVEAAALAGYVYTSGASARPLTRGKYARMFRFGAFAAGIALPAVLTVTRQKPGRKATVVSGLLSLAGALALKWAVVHAGRESSQDAPGNRHASRADATNPGWMPATHDRTAVLSARPAQE